MKILLIEDDMDLGNGVRIVLSDQAMEVVWVRQLNDAEHQVNTAGFDLILLDLGLPDGDGMHFLARLRRDKKTIPVIVFSARDSIEDRLLGLDTGADDYLVKPFVLAELLSRIRALVRRSYGFEGDTMSVRGLSVQDATRRVTVDERLVELTASEYTLLKMLIMRIDHVVTRRSLEDQALRSSQANPSNTLDVHMGNLRRKIGEGYVRTVRGVGYIIDQQLPEKDRQ